MAPWSGQCASCIHGCTYVTDRKKTTTVSTWKWRIFLFFHECHGLFCHQEIYPHKTEEGRMSSAISGIVMYVWLAGVWEVVNRDRRQDGGCKQIVAVVVHLQGFFRPPSCLCHPAPCSSWPPCVSLLSVHPPPSTSVLVWTHPGPVDINALSDSFTVTARRTEDHQSYVRRLQILQWSLSALGILWVSPLPPSSSPHPPSG